jgi:hypothetical protein
MYQDGVLLESSTHIGYARDGSIGIFLGSKRFDRGGNLTIAFHRIIIPGTGPVWIRGVWVYEVES